MSSTFKRHLDAAEGFLALKLPLEAWEELENLEPEERAVPEVILLRLRILLALEKFVSAIVIGNGAVRNFPSYGEFYMLTARAMRSANNVTAAREMLLSGEHVLAEDAQWNFELARCECLLGDLEAAKHRLQRALSFDLKVRLVALVDGSLKPLWDSLSDVPRKGTL